MRKLLVIGITSIVKQQQQVQHVRVETQLDAGMDGYMIEQIQVVQPMDV